MKLTTSSLEKVRSALAAMPAWVRTITVQGKTYAICGHQSSGVTRYNLTVGNKYYTELTLSGVAAAIVEDIEV